MIKVDSKFELAFRRTLFIAIILAIYLLFGTLIFLSFASINTEKIRPQRLEKLDFERSELLNVLWAEFLGRSEHDWTHLANKKLDSYERSLQNLPNDIWESADGSIPVKALDTFSEAFEFSFQLITTIGGIEIGSIGNDFTKIFAIFYTLCGIPLVLIYLSQCSKALTALFSTPKKIFLATIISILLMGLIWDITEGNNGDIDDTPFFDAIYGVFLTVSTNGICGQHYRPPPLLLYLFSILGVALLQSLISLMQRAIERRIGRYEFAFSQRVAQVERVISGDRLDELPEEEEEEQDYSNRKVSVHFSLDDSNNDFKLSSSDLKQRKTPPKKAEEDTKEEEEKTIHFILNTINPSCEDKAFLNNNINQKEIQSKEVRETLENIQKEEEAKTIYFTLNPESTEDQKNRFNLDEENLEDIQEEEDDDDEKSEYQSLHLFEN